MNTIVKGRPRSGMFAKAASKAIEEAVETKPVEQSTMRPSMRDEDPRAAAAKRAAELRGHLGEMEEGTDTFYVDPYSIPDGWTYEWKRHSVYGLEDPSYQIKVAREGWEPVPAERHPDMMPYNTKDAVIMRDGLVLMQCPTEIVEERRRLELKKARDQVRYKEAQIAGTPDGTMTRDHARVKPQIKKSFEAMPIPEE